MSYRKFKIVLSKGWTLLVCSVSVAVIALMGSCRSKKATKTQEPVLNDDQPSEEVVEPRSGNDLSPTLTLPGDSKEVKEMIQQVNSLKDELSGRMNSVIYGTPEIMQRRAEENRLMRNQIDSLNNEIQKARQK